MHRRARALLVATLFPLAIPASATVWTNIGPGGEYISTVTIDPVTPSTLYATSGLRVFKSTDAGLAWVALAHPVGEILIGEVVVDPLNPSTIFIGGGGADVVKSTDGGATLVPY